jgi:hypothetical protein
LVDHIRSSFRSGLADIWPWGESYGEGGHASTRFALALDTP